MKKKRRGVFLKITLAFSVFLFACLFSKCYSTLKDRNNEKEALEAQISEEIEYGKKLDKTSEEYGSDEYVEQYARSLGLVKPNEKVYRNYNDKK